MADETQMIAQMINASAAQTGKAVAAEMAAAKDAEGVDGTELLTSVKSARRLINELDGKLKPEAGWTDNAFEADTAFMGRPDEDFYRGKFKGVFDLVPYAMPGAHFIEKVAIGNGPGFYMKKAARDAKEIVNHESQLDAHYNSISDPNKAESLVGRYMQMLGVVKPLREPDVYNALDAATKAQVDSITKYAVDGLKEVFEQVSPEELLQVFEDADVNP